MFADENEKVVFSFPFNPVCRSWFAVRENEDEDVIASIR